MSMNDAGRLSRPGPDYTLLCRQLEALAEESPWYVPLLANASALLYEALPDVNWAGFYLMRARDGRKDTDGRELILGPFQGRPACVRIPIGRGVCGTAAALDRTQLVPDVHLFPGHIACDSASNAEIVVPIHGRPAGPGCAAEREVIGVLDIDSPVRDRFSEADREGLEALVRVLEGVLRLE